MDFGFGFDDSRAQECVYSVCHEEAGGEKNYCFKEFSLDDQVDRCWDPDYSGTDWDDGEDSH